SGRRSGMSSIRLDSDDEIEQLPPDIAAKARALLMSLVRPQLRMVVFLAVIVVLTSVLLVIGPVFIADALDQGIPAAIAGDLAEPRLHLREAGRHHLADAPVPPARPDVHACSAPRSGLPREVDLGSTRVPAALGHGVGAVVPVVLAVRDGAGSAADDLHRRHP